MDLRMIVIALVTMCEAEMAPVLRSQSRHRRGPVKTARCDSEWYFDPNLGENGRCQPCSEICDPIWGTKDQCLANIDQCRDTYMNYYSTTTLTVLQSTPTTKFDVEPKPQTIVIVAVATGLVALVTCALLAIYLYRNHRKSIKKCCRSCLNRPRHIKPVGESSPHVSREQICVSNVNNPISSASQALLSRCQQETVSQSQNLESIV